MPFEGGILGRGWRQDGIDPSLDQGFQSGPRPYPDGASADAHPTTMLAFPGTSPGRSATAHPAAALPPNMNPADPDYGFSGPAYRPNECDDPTADACTYPDLNSYTIQTGHNSDYWRYGDVVRRGIDIHEDSHKPWLQYWLDGLPWEDRLGGR